MTGNGNGNAAIAAAHGLYRRGGMVDGAESSAWRIGAAAVARRDISDLTPEQIAALDALVASSLRPGDPGILEDLEDRLTGADRRVFRRAVSLAFGAPARDPAPRIAPELAQQIAAKVAAKEATGALADQALAAYAAAQNRHARAKTVTEGLRLSEERRAAREAYEVARAAHDRATVGLTNLLRDRDARHMAAALAESTK